MRKPKGDNARNPKECDSRVRNMDRNKKRSKRDTLDRDYEKQDGSNDPAWYGKYPELLRDSASIPFSWSTGVQIDMGTPATVADVPNKVANFIVPGIQAIMLMPACGSGEGLATPINIAATNVFTSVRRANAGSTNYDAPDLMLYLLAMSSVYSYIVWLERIYAEATLYSQRNRYLPRTLLSAEGVDFDSVSNNLADFRYGINLLINKAASLSVPSDMPAFNRAAFLYQSLYTEGTSIKDQLYMYVPGGFWEYQESAGPGSLSTYLTQAYANAYGNVGIKYEKYDTLIAAGNSMIQKLITSQDINIMSGDILKAYGPERCMKLVTMPEYVPITPVFNIGVLEQMKNAAILQMWGTPPAILQDTDAKYLYSDVQSSMQAPSDPGVNNGWNEFLYQFHSQNSILSTTTEDTTPELVIESTRLMAKCAGMGLSTGSDDTQSYELYCGTEVAIACVYWTLNVDGSASARTFWDNVIEYRSVGSPSDHGTTVVQVANDMALIANFDFHPLFVIVASNGTGLRSNGNISKIVWDVDNYAILTPSDLRRMHEAALMSEFNVPIANINR